MAMLSCRTSIITPVSMDSRVDTVQEYRAKIRRMATERGVSRLYHFTRAENARSILSHGLASRNVLLDNGIDFLATDSMRLDEHLDALSLSVHWINSAMFDKKKREIGGEWLILEIDASLLWTHSCRFCWANAATSEMRRQRAFLGGPWAFGMMFEDRPISHADGRSYRKVFQRADNRPTDDAAEVQVLDPIAPELIIDVTVRNDIAKDWLGALMQEVGQIRPIEVYADIFR